MSGRSASLSLRLAVVSAAREDTTARDLMAAERDLMAAQGHK